jgi:magnesium transporter
MLKAYPRPLIVGASLSIRDLADQTWVDLINPTEAERSAFERASGLNVPSKDDVAEIEATSRLKIENDALYMTAPLIFAAENEPWLPTPVGFVLSKQLLMTVRFAASAAGEGDERRREAGSDGCLRAAARGANRSPRGPSGISEPRS